MLMRSAWPCCLTLVCAALLPHSPLRAEDAPAAPAVEFPFRDGDRLAIMGSSSTRIGVWPKTLMFLLATRHPELNITHERFSVGTFGAAREPMEAWLAEFKPTVVLFNFGGNDAKVGRDGLGVFRENMAACVAKALSAGARPILMTHQSADIRKSGAEPFALRKLYAEDMIAFAAENGWAVIDTHHPLERLQLDRQATDSRYTILKDTIHLTEPGYIAWGYYLYERLNPPRRESAATLTAEGRVTSLVGCKVTNVDAGEAGLVFTREDQVLPILPPTALPPREHVPLEKLSAYRLAVTGLPEGTYQILVMDKPVGSVPAAALAEGVNLSSLLLESGAAAPWEQTSEAIWNGDSETIGKTRWKFEVRKQ